MRIIIHHGKHECVMYMYSNTCLYATDRSRCYTSFQPNQKIKVRISGDGARFSRTSSFVLLSYAILMPVGRYLSGIGKNLNVPVTQPETQ